MFTAMLAKFKEYIKHGLDVEIPKFKASLSEVTEKKEADKFANAITEALGMIGSTAVNNKYYKLLLNPDLEESNDDVVLDSKIEEELEKRGLYVDIKDDHVEEAMNEADDKIDEQYDYEATCVEFAKHIVPSLLNSTSLKALADADGNSENAIAWVICSLAEHIKATAKDVELKKLGEKVSEACMEVML